MSTGINKAKMLSLTVFIVLSSGIDAQRRFADAMSAMDAGIGHYG